MAEILTESFCERCGTRYTFQAAVPRKQRLGKVKTLSRGLRKYVLDDNTSLDEAFAEARSEEEREVSSHQLEAFHQTFNFCMTCRQYTCANCWNEVEGRCLTCAPDLSREVPAEAFGALGATIAPAPETNGHDAAPDDLAWPLADLRREGLGSADDEAEADASLAVDDEAPVEAAAVEPDEIPDVDILARLNALAPEPAPEATTEQQRPLEAEPTTVEADSISAPEATP
ncbi:MAG TPA: hypothetical protein VFR93_09565, partial [Candidatus Limnocylindrales bacterium]|nr:hypothetical protein [Candidatus Limnocylindrales bacterium]